MLTLKKLNEKIKQLEIKNKENEKLNELDTYLNRIKKYQKENINNAILIQINDLTERKVIFTTATTEFKQEN